MLSEYTQTIMVAFHSGDAVHPWLICWGCLWTEAQVIFIVLCGNHMLREVISLLTMDNISDVCKITPGGAGGVAAALMVQHYPVIAHTPNCAMPDGNAVNFESEFFRTCQINSQI